MIHELGHILDERSSLRQKFLSTPGVSGLSGPEACYTYPFPSDCNEAEKFAEGTALFVVYKTQAFKKYGGTYNFKAKFPNDDQWYHDNVFGMDF